MPFDLEFNKNEDQFKQLVEQLQHKSKKIKLGAVKKKLTNNIRKENLQPASGLNI